MKTFICLSSAQKSVPLILVLLWSPCLLSAQLTVTVTGTRVTCFGATDGQATATPVGGGPPYAYLWNNGGTTQTIQNLALGTYTVTVTDINQNTKSAIGNVTSPNNIALNVTNSAQLCGIAPDGVAKCIPSGGTMPYSYLWSNGSTSQQIFKLIAGAYTVTVTDSKGCTKQKSTQVEDDTDKGLSASISTTPTYCDYDVGAANIWMMSGTPPYSYSWSNGDSSPLIENLAAGTYTVSVTDVNGCSAVDTLLIFDQGLPVEASMFSFTPCGYTSGTATIDPTAGTPPYQFQWSTGETTQMIDSLAGGTYTATVTDATGCSGTGMTYISSGGNPILAQLIGLKCFNKIAAFTHDAPALYPDLSWSLNDTLDKIISGQGTDSIEVQWGSTGHKIVIAYHGINGVSCGGYGFIFDVFVCADTNEPGLAAAMVSPNPFSDFLQIEFPTDFHTEAMAVLTDVSGKLVLEKRLLDPAERLFTANLPAGIYFLKIKLGEGERVWRVAKQ